MQKTTVSEEPMGKFSSIMIASDFDRTLTDPQDQIPQSNLDAIR